MKGVLGSARATGRKAGDRAEPPGHGKRMANYLEDLRPQVLAVFESENIAALPRPEIAVRIGQVVTEATEADNATLNLLDRRNLVADLINWLLRDSPLAPPKPAEPAATSAARTKPAEAPSKTGAAKQPVDGDAAGSK